MPSPSPFVSDRTGSAAVSALLVIAGIGFIVVWLGAAGVWAVMSLMGGLMSDGIGRLPSDKHWSMLLVLLGGEVLVAAAGIPGGLAFFWSEQRGLLLWIFAGLLVTGGALEIWALGSFLFPAE